MTEMTVAEGRGVMQFVHVVLLLVDAQQALVQREGLTHREVTLASGGGCGGDAVVVVMVGDREEGRLGFSSVGG